MPPVCFAGHRPLAMAIAPVRPATSEQRCQQPWPRSSSLTNPSPSRPPAVCSVSNKVIAISRTDRPRRPNPHRARPTLDTPSTRVRSLAACRRRPPGCTAPFATSRRPQPFTDADFAETPPRISEHPQCCYRACDCHRAPRPSDPGRPTGCTPQALPGCHHVGSMWISHSAYN
jgi:hypothetical protein